MTHDGEAIFNAFFPSRKFFNIWCNLLKIERTSVFQICRVAWQPRAKLFNLGYFFPFLDGGSVTYFVIFLGFIYLFFNFICVRVVLLPACSSFPCYG
jgi:hypothetical protein